MTAPVPFVGLRPFDTNDADWFFGRDRETSTLAAKLRSAGFTAVVGPSGSGKSSLVRAGVVPQLREQGWKEIIAKPGSAPIERLARALATADPDTHFIQARYFRYDTTLRASAFGLVQIVEALGADAPRLLLVIDQFEELFRYGDEATGASKAGMREESRAFVELLLAGASGSNGRLHVCVTMRSDFFGACSSFAGLAEAISVSQYLVPMPARSQLELAIRKPVERAGAEIEEVLVQRLLVDVQEEQDQLPLLQHTLRRLWEFASGEPRTMREQDYVRIGKIAGSIDHKAEAIWETVKANASDRVTMERVMKALTDLDVRGRATRRMQKRSELLALLQAPALADPEAADPEATETSAAETSLDRVIGALAKEENSFLQLGQGADPEVDIGHEALIRSWTRLSGPRRDFERGWLREERDDGDRWRGYIARAKEGTRLSLQERLSVSNWLRRRSLGEEWSRRYGDRWEEVKAFIASSWRRGMAWASAGAIFLVLLGAGLWHQEAIKQEAKTFFVIGPFAKSKVWPHVLQAADEQALAPFTSFAECDTVASCPEMVVIPPGKFTMGTNSGLPHERPPHEVEIVRRFAAGKYEVTNAQWTSCVNYGWCRDNLASQAGSGNHPVVSISWEDAQVYVDWLSQMTRKEYRLLSEAEWEYVARAGTTTPYYWDNSADIRPGGIEAGRANCADCRNGDRVDNRATLPVGTFPPNQWGLCDTRGNVWELVDDMYHPDYTGDPPLDGSAWWTKPDYGDRIARGGSVRTYATSLTATYRFNMLKNEHYPGVGFRVARTLDAKPADANSADQMKLASQRGTPRRDCRVIERPQ